MDELRHPHEDGHWDVEHIRRLLFQRDRLEAEAKDARYLVAALIKAAGGRMELSMTTVMSIGPKDQITHWDDPISGKKVYMLTEMTASDAVAKP